MVRFLWSLVARDSAYVDPGGNVYGDKDFLGQLSFSKSFDTPVRAPNDDGIFSPKGAADPYGLWSSAKLSKYTRKVTANHNRVTITRDVTDTDLVVTHALSFSGFRPIPDIQDGGLPTQSFFSSAITGGGTFHDRTAGLILDYEGDAAIAGTLAQLGIIPPGAAAEFGVMQGFTEISSVVKGNFVLTTYDMPQPFLAPMPDLNASDFELVYRIYFLGTRVNGAVGVRHHSLIPSVNIVSSSINAILI